jgi:retron-type reverse transcriptase
MAVNKDFLSYLEAKCKGENPRHIVFEGDRLFSATNLRYILDKYQTRICILKQSEEALHKRHMARGDTQSEKFLKGRKTKIDNIQKEFSGNSEIFWLNEISDTKSLSGKLWRWLSEDTL